jgi:hypothetical protein
MRRAAAGETHWGASQLEAPPNGREANGRPCSSLAAIDLPNLRSHLFVPHRPPMYFSRSTELRALVPLATRTKNSVRVSFGPSGFW